MGKKVLAIYYSQSGQLGEIIDCFVAPLAEAGVSIEKVRIKPSTDYPFPWTGEQFYSVMPDCVFGVPVELAPFALKETSYDLIILGYQAWFLYPSIPSISLLKHPAFIDVLRNTPVITITGARNMWLNAFEEVKKTLSAAGTRLVGNIALVDRHPNHISFITIFHWLLGGRKDRYLNIFPFPGVAASDIANTKVFGNTVLHYLNKNDWEGMQQELVLQRAVEWKYSLMLLETKALPTYSLWARFLVKRKKRKAWLAVFKYYLLFSLFIAAPLILALDAVFIRPFSAKRIKEKKQHYLALK
jgi:hypothetical protein